MEVSRGMVHDVERTVSTLTYLFYKDKPNTEVRHPDGHKAGIIQGDVGEYLGALALGVPFLKGMRVRPWEEPEGCDLIGPRGERIDVKTINPCHQHLKISTLQKHKIDPAKTKTTHFLIIRWEYREHHRVHPDADVWGMVTVQDYYRHHHQTDPRDYKLSLDHSTIVRFA